MTNSRLAGYLSLTLWEGSLAAVAWNNSLNAHWNYLAVNAVLIAGVLLILALMRRKDRARGYLVDRRPDRQEGR